MARYTRKQVEHLLAICNAEYIARHDDYDNPFYPDGPYHLGGAYDGWQVEFSPQGSGCTEIMSGYGTMRECYMFANGLYHGYMGR